MFRSQFVGGETSPPVMGIFHLFGECGGDPSDGSRAFTIGFIEDV